MEYEIFKGVVEEKFKELLPEQYQDATVVISPVNKVKILDKLFDQTKYAAKVELLATELAEAFIANLQRNDVDKAVGTLCEAIRDEPLKEGERGGR